jgi:hypothetical protein
MRGVFAMLATAAVVLQHQFSSAPGALGGLCSSNPDDSSSCTTAAAAACPGSPCSTDHAALQCALTAAAHALHPAAATLRQQGRSRTGTVIIRTFSTL